MDQSKDILIQRFLQSTEDLFHLLAPNISLEGLESDVTVAQIRVMLVLRAERECSMSEIAAAVGVVPSTATGIVDGLVARGLIVRDNDAHDRRKVICRLSKEGEGVIYGLWKWGRSQIEKLLLELSSEQLQNGCEVAEELLSLQRRESQEISC